MVERSEIPGAMARIKFQLYCEYGIGRHPNYLLMRVDDLSREDVVNALQYPEVRKMAKRRLRRQKRERAELKELLAEADAIAADTPPSP